MRSGHLLPTNRQGACIHLGMLLLVSPLLSACGKGIDADTQIGKAGNSPTMPTSLIARSSASNSVRLSLSGVILTVPKPLAAYARKSDELRSSDTKLLGLPVRLPEILQSTLGHIVSNAPLSTDMLIGFSFWYPDMTLACTGTQCTDANESRSGPERRFKVYVGSLFHQSEIPAKGYEPRPFQMLQNIAGDMQPERNQSPFSGLTEITFEQSLIKRYPGIQKQWDKSPGTQGHLYFAELNRPYDLIMACTSICVVDAYSKKTHFQVHLIIPLIDSREAQLPDELMLALDRMLEQWQR